MVEQSIKLLNKQMDKLKEEDFDLEAWKASSVALLGRVFGINDLKIKQIKEIKMDFGSWSLRDTGASRDPLGSCKKQGKEILRMAVDELKAFGLPRLDESTQLKKALESELTVSQYNSLNKILDKQVAASLKSKEIIQKLESFGDKKLATILNFLLQGE